MATPRVPGRAEEISLPCGRSIDPTAIDLGMRDLHCACGENHGIVLDVHPPTRFFPSEVVDVLQATVEPADGGEFGTRHLMGMAVEEFPETLEMTDVRENPQLGCQYVWVSSFDSPRLHSVLVELVLELMDHAMSHSEDIDAREEFSGTLEAFDVDTFVQRYREERDVDPPM